MEKKADWSISDLYSRAFNIVKKYKVTWAFGMALALASGASFNSSGNFPSDFSKNQQDTTHQISQVLGASTSSPWESVINNIFSQIPTSFYVLLGVEIFFVIVVLLIVNMIFHAWSEGSLTHATNDANLHNKPLMADSSEKAFYNIKSLIWLYIVPGLAVFVITILAMLIGAFLFFVFKNITPLVIIFLIPIAIVFLIGLILLALSMIWASRITILEGKPAWQSLKIGFQIVRKKKWSMILLGFVNMIISSAVIFAPILLGIGLFLVGLILYFLNHALLPILITLGTLLLIVLIAGAFLLSGIITAWKNAVWTIAYREIKGKYD